MKIIPNFQRAQACKLCLLPISKIIIILGLVIGYWILVSPVHAQDSSPSAAPQEATDSGLSSKIKSIQDQIASKAAELKAEMNKKIGNKAFTGTISVMTTDTITISTDNGTKTIKINEFTIYQNNSKQRAKRTLLKDDLASDDTIIGLGEVDETGVMTAKKIVKTDPILRKVFSYIYGDVTKVEPTQLVLIQKSGVEKTIGISAKTPVKVGTEVGKLEDITNSKTVIAVFEGATEASESGFLYVLPTGGLKTLGVKKEATSSAD